MTAYADTSHHKYSTLSFTTDKFEKKKKQIHKTLVKWVQNQIKMATDHFIAPLGAIICGLDDFSERNEWTLAWYYLN